MLSCMQGWRFGEFSALGLVYETSFFSDAVLDPFDAGLILLICTGLLVSEFFSVEAGESLELVSEFLPLYAPFSADGVNVTSFLSETIFDLSVTLLGPILLISTVSTALELLVSLDLAAGEMTFSRGHLLLILPSNTKTESVFTGLNARCSSNA